MISICIKSDEDELCVEVIDDGVGFDARIASSEPGHFGLSLMRERVEAVGGRLTVDSRLGGGTRVHVRLPLAEGRHGTPEPA
jgi:signal transduction histidine kinase